MFIHRVTIVLILSAFFGLAAVPSSAAARGPVTLHVSTGYGEMYQPDAWTPVRVRLRNASDSDVRGTLEIPDSPGSPSSGFSFPPQPYTARYEMPLVLPAGETKSVTMYIPGMDVSGDVEVHFRSGGRVVASGYSTPNTYATGDTVVASLAGSPVDAAWLRHANTNFVTLDVAELTPATLDPVPEALANFDILTISNVDTGRLDARQMAAIEAYVKRGGSLLLVGGPDWAETLRPLPPALIPGTLSGARRLPGLAALHAPSSPTVVTVLTHPQGQVLASQSGVPLVVRSSLGAGHILYLAFDPGIAPIAGWRGAPDVVTHLLTEASPEAVSRSAWPSSLKPPSPFWSSWGPPPDISQELSNLPAAALPSILLFIILVGAYVVLLGPLNAIVLRRLHRRELTWVTIPVLGLLCVGTTFAVAFRLKGNAVVVNTVGLVQIDSDDGEYPADLYVGLFAPVRGDYNLTYSGSALPAAVPQYQYGGPLAGAHPLGLRLQESGDTAVTFAGMNMWSMRDAVLHTEVSLRGTIRPALHLNSRGNIVGTITNTTPMELYEPVIFAGNSVRRLSAIPPHGVLSVSIRPSYDIRSKSSQPAWITAYGQPRYGGYYGPRTFPGLVASGGSWAGVGGGWCCPGPTTGPERTLSDRIRNTASMLPGAQLAATQSEVSFAAWTQQPLGSFKVDGSSPQRRDLNLLIMPLSVRFPVGHFRLRTGTLTAHLVDIDPQITSSPCCPRPPGTAPVFVGAGGSATFAWQMPRATRVHFRRLVLSVDAGGAIGTHIGTVWNWRRDRWDPINLRYGDAPLSNPDRYVSPSGTVLLRLHATDASRDISMPDTRQALQISGEGEVE